MALLRLLTADLAAPSTLGHSKPAALRSTKRKKQIFFYDFHWIAFSFFVTKPT